MRGRGRGEHGQALVELAIVLPILLLLLTGMIQFGLMLNKYLSLNDAARAGARELALGGGLNDPCDPAVANALATGAGLNLQSSQVTVGFANTSTDHCSTGTYTYNPSYTSTTNTNTTGNFTEGDQGSVTVSQPFTLSVFGLGVFNLNLSASASDAGE